MRKKRIVVAVHSCSTEKEMERRRAVRYDLRLPVELIHCGRKSASVQGETRNVSSSGVLFSADSRLSVGEPLEYVITLSSDHTTPVQIHCMGKVVRSTGVSEAAATLERYEFVRGGKSRSQGVFSLSLAKLW